MTGRTLVFDLDGTLSDNYEGIAGSIRHALVRLGAPDPGDAALRACVGPPLRESFARLVPGADAAIVETAIGHYRERYRELGWRENVVYAGVGELLASLARDHTLYVCTSKPEVFASRIVTRFGFDAHLARVYGADLAGTYDDKRKLLGRLVGEERIEPAKATMIGDRHHDLAAARAHGLRAIGVLWGYGDAEELAGADRLVATPSELEEAIRAG